MQNHIEFGNEGMQIVKENEKRLDVIESNYMKRDEVLKQLDLMRDYMEKNYVRK